MVRSIPAQAAFSIMETAISRAVNLTLCAPPESVRQRISSGAATPATARPEARTLRTACTNANLAKVDFRSV